MSVSKDIVKQLAEKHGLTNKVANTFVTELLESIKSNMKKGNKVAFKDFGTFVIRHRKARIGINPATRAKINIPAKKVVKFVPAKAVKELVK